MYRDRKEQYDHTISIMMHEASDNSMNSKAIIGGTQKQKEEGNTDFNRVFTFLHITSNAGRDFSEFLH